MIARRVLILEDEPVLLVLIQRLFQRVGVEVEISAVGTVQAALKLVDNQDFDLLLSDMSLPDGRGTEVIERFRSRFPGKPVIVMGGSLTLETEAGAIDESLVCLPKPFSVDTFHNVVSTALASL